LKTKARRVGILRDLILEGPKTKEKSQPHGRIGRPAIVAVDFTTAAGVRESQSDAIGVAKWDIK